VLQIANAVRPIPLRSFPCQIRQSSYREAKSRTDVEFPGKPKKVASDKNAEIHGSFESLLRSTHFRYSQPRIKLMTEKAIQVAAAFLAAVAQNIKRLVRFLSQPTTPVLPATT